MLRHLISGRLSEAALRAEVWAMDDAEDMLVEVVSRRLDEAVRFAISFCKYRLGAVQTCAHLVDLEHMLKKSPVSLSEASMPPQTNLNNFI